MTVINPGNMLPVYFLPNSQMANQAGCEEFNWAIPVPQGQDLTVEFPVPAGGNGLWDWAAVNADTGAEVALDAALLNYSESHLGEAWLAYHADGGLSLLLAASDPGCVKWYFRFFNTTAGIEYHSERWRTVDLHVNKNIYKLTFSHSKDIDGILYSGGYFQKVWIIDAIFDTPAIVKQSEVVTDGNAVEIKTFQSVQVRNVLKFPYFPDFWSSVFPKLEKYDTITLEKRETGEVFDLANSNLEFTTEKQDTCFSLGILSWISSVQVMAGCEENENLSIKNNLVIG